MQDNFSLNDKILMGVTKGMLDNFPINANVRIELFGKDGVLKETREVHNTVTTAGKYGVIDQIAGTPTLPKGEWMEVGTGTGGTTKLNTYVAGSRTAITSAIRSTNLVTYLCTFGAAVGTGALTEIGLFDVVTQDTVNMWLYATFSVINKAAGDSLAVTWTLTAG